ncbi:hypothetical protein [Celeribacter sp. PS-C1]|uniref:hypothetical protein n=1 Tax=Celeribacter sp. PS-C1 TaxID=2820813 RepID=UPI001CA59AB3|nr:hypothetical protein [Celeribacter sp. PS-C1]MBW6417804.1 hypothetical protein [Celeribacter sp. PS-C1]
MNRKANTWRFQSIYFFAFLGVLGALVVVAPALAQSPDGPLVIPSEIDVRARGWSQLTNWKEVLEFALAVVETTVFTALLAFHPANRDVPSKVLGGELQKGMFLFALIGMLTGFLVMHHGYLIGFVIFGIGGLFRFRMESSTIADTGQLVVTSLAGLAVGLDLPVMAMIGTIAAWFLLQIFGKTKLFGLEVKFEEKKNSLGLLRDLPKMLEEKGFSVVTVTKAKFKPTVRYTLSSRKPGAQNLLIEEMTEMQATGKSGVVDWHVD